MLPASAYTLALSINDNDSVTGYFTDSLGTHGFVRTAQGAITVFNGLGGSRLSYGYSINANGIVAGQFRDRTGHWYGLVFTPGSGVAGFYAPGSYFTFAQAINSSATVTGYYALSGRILGFLRSPSGTITSFAAPGANSTQAVQH